MNKLAQASIFDLFCIQILFESEKVLNFSSFFPYFLQFCYVFFYLFFFSISQGRPSNRLNKHGQTCFLCANRQCQLKSY